MRTGGSAPNAGHSATRVRASGPTLVEARAESTSCRRRDRRRYSCSQSGSVARLRSAAARSRTRRDAARSGAPYRRGTAANCPRFLQRRPSSTCATRGARTPRQSSVDRIAPTTVSVSPIAGGDRRELTNAAGLRINRRIPFHPPFLAADRRRWLRSYLTSNALSGSDVW